MTAATAAALPLPRVDAAPVLVPMPVPVDQAPATQPALVALADAHLRRCTFRRLSVVTPVSGPRRKLPMYAVECLYAGMDAPLALGDLSDAHTICGACTYPGIFRADED